MKHEVWRLIRSGPLPGSMNMALDDALLQAVAAGESPPVLRLYRWQPAALTLGYAQKVDGSVDLQACRAGGLDVVRRPTGGRAVLHAVEVTYAVISRCLPPFGTSVSTSYRVVAGILQSTLQQLGLAVELVPGKVRGSQGKAVCFVAPAQHELLVAGCKVAGCAQKRRGAAFLQHGSLPLELDLALLEKILPPPPGDERPERLAGIGWLNRFAPRPLTIAEVEAALIDNFARELDVTLIESLPTTSETQLAMELCERFYADSQWTVGGPGVAAAAACGELPA